MREVFTILALPVLLDLNSSLTLGVVLNQLLFSSFFFKKAEFDADCVNNDRNTHFSQDLEKGIIASAQILYGFKSFGISLMF